MKRPASATLHSLRCRLFRRATAGREAFAIIETLIVIGVIGAVTALTIPLYREYQIRSDLDNAAQLAQQGLGRAKLLSQSGERDSQWGFYVPNGTLYKGPSYENRDQSFDEVFPMPSTIAISGLLEVGYSKIEGKPNAVGDIVLRALNNDERTIQVTIAVDSQTIPTNQGDVITICHQSQTIQVPDATWPTHQSHGDTLGPCAGGGASSVASSAASSTQSSAGTSSSAGGGGGGASSAGGGGGGGGTIPSECTSKFTVGTNGTITITGNTTATFTNKQSLITFGAGGPPIPVHACYSVNNGSSYSTLFGNNGNCSGNGNAYGTAVKPAGTDTKTKSLTVGQELAARFHARFKLFGWLAVDEKFSTVDGSGRVRILLNGEELADYPGFANQTPIKNYLIGIGKANASGIITLGPCEVLVLAELIGLQGTSSWDFQDDVMLISFQ